MELFDLKRVKEDIEEKENFYKAEALESYLLYMWKHYSKIANRLYDDYMELIRKESKTPDSSHSNFLAIKEVLNEYEWALAARKSYDYALIEARDRVRHKVKRLNKINEGLIKLENAKY